MERPFLAAQVGVLVKLLRGGHMCVAENELGISGWHAKVLEHGRCRMPRVMHGNARQPCLVSYLVESTDEVLRVDRCASGTEEDQLLIRSHLVGDGGDVELQLNTQRAKLSRDDQDARRKADEQAAMRVSDRRAAAERAQALLPQAESAISELRRFVPVNKRIYLGDGKGVPAFGGGTLFYGRSGFLRQPVRASIRVGLRFLNWKRSYILEGWVVEGFRVPFDGTTTIGVNNTVAKGFDFASSGLNRAEKSEYPIDEFAHLGTYSYTVPYYDYDARSPSGSEIVTVSVDEKLQKFISSAAKLVAELERRSHSGEPLYPPTKSR